MVNLAPVHDTTASRVEVEYSIAWIQENPTEFDSSYATFMRAVKGYDVTSTSTPGFITFVARRGEAAQEKKSSRKTPEPSTLA